MSPAEFWVNNVYQSDVQRAADFARRLENDGWDGVVYFDSQCMFPELWTSLAYAASITSTLQLATGATNPVTRHPSVTASAAGTAQRLSNGRVTLGVGRGDSAVTHVGGAPMSIDRFEERIAMLQAYLKGEGVDTRDAASLLVDSSPTFDQLAISDSPPASRVHWIDDAHPKVPIEVMATGPLAIDAGVRVAEKVVFALGADVNRLSWGIDRARATAALSGRETPCLGAYVQVFPHSKVDVARDLVRGIVATYARFSVMNRRTYGPLTPSQRIALTRLGDAYDYNAHGSAGSQTAVLDDEFVDNYAIVGDPEHCVRRLRQLIDLGLTRFTVALPVTGDDAEREVGYRLLTDEVLPALRN